MLWIFCILGHLSDLLAEATLAAVGNKSSLTVSSTPAQPYSNFTEAKNQSHDQIPGVYVPLPAPEIGACSITDKYCTYNGTARNADGLKNQCLLWDDTCSGNQTLAIDHFFGQTRAFLFENVCFTGDGSESVASNCTRQNTPARFTEFERIKNWMRSPQCITGQGLYQKVHPTLDTEGMRGEKCGYEKRDNSTGERRYGGGTCCGTCNIEAGNVDILLLAGSKCQHLLSEHYRQQGQPT